MDCGRHRLITLSSALFLQMASGSYGRLVQSGLVAVYTGSCTQVDSIYVGFQRQGGRSPAYTPHNKTWISGFMHSDALPSFKDPHAL